MHHHHYHHHHHNFWRFFYNGGGVGYREKFFFNVWKFFYRGVGCDLHFLISENCQRGGMGWDFQFSIYGKNLGDRVGMGWTCGSNFIYYYYLTLNLWNILERLLIMKCNYYMCFLQFIFFTSTFWRIKMPFCHPIYFS